MRRKRLWWKSKDARFHSKRFCHELRHRDDPEALWKCCPYWQRKLSNKWNGREWAQRHGVRVPELYWRGRDVDAIPFESLPSHYVIRSTSGSNRKGVMVIAEGFDYVADRSFTIPEIRARAAQLLGSGFSETLLMVEEFVRDERGRLEQAIDYKFDMFGEEIAGILTVHRHPPGTPAERRRSGTNYYTPDWEPIDEKILRRFRTSGAEEPPACLDELTEAAKRLGRSYGTYVRVDLYATDRGCVFGEFSPIPGGGNSFTEFGAKRLESYWSRIFPDRV